MESTKDFVVPNGVMKLYWSQLMIKSVKEMKVKNLRLHGGDRHVIALI